MEQLIIKTLLAEKIASDLGFWHTAEVLKHQADSLLAEHGYTMQLPKRPHNST